MQQKLSCAWVRVSHEYNDGLHPPWHISTCVFIYRQATRTYIHISLYVNTNLYLHTYLCVHACIHVRVSIKTLGHKTQGTADWVISEKNASRTAVWPSCEYDEYLELEGVTLYFRSRVPVPHNAFVDVLLGKRGCRWGCSSIRQKLPRVCWAICWHWDQKHHFTWEKRRWTARAQLVRKQGGIDAFSPTNEHPRQMSTQS